MNIVVCNSIGKCDLCVGCGAAKPHYGSDCEPCPVVEDAHCITVANGFTLDEYHKQTTKIDFNNV